MSRSRRHIVTLLAALMGIGCGGELPLGAGGAGGSGGGGAGGAGGGPFFDWNLPAGIPKPKVPEDNPMTAEKVELGRHLFFDTRLSGNQTFSCGSCHDQALAFTDGKAVSPGSTGELTPRSAMALTNVAYLSNLTWANPTVTSLEHQAKLPMFGEFPVELGLSGMEDELFQRLRDEPVYAELFLMAFPDGEGDRVDLANILAAIASFERVLLSFDSPYDRLVYGGKPSAMSESAKRGKDLFLSERTQCHHCHGGFNFTDQTTHEGTTFIEEPFHNTGLYNVDGEGAYPDGNAGLVEISFEPGDMGRFRAPSLRNVALTAPYMHDGTVGSLADVIDIYARGGRLIETGPFAGDGALNPWKSEFVAGFDLTPEEKADLIEFLHALTDESFITNPAFTNPWSSP